MRFLLLLAALALSHQAAACSCAVRSGSLENRVTEKFEQADSVVLAQVEGVRNILLPSLWSGDNEHLNGEETHFSVVQSWKGTHGKQFYTKIITDCCMCGVTFGLAEIHLLYLYQDKEDGYYVTSSCSGNRPLERAGAEIKILNELAPMKPGSRGAIIGDIE